MSIGFLGLTPASLAQVRRIADRGEVPLVWDKEASTLGSIELPKLAPSPLATVQDADSVVITYGPGHVVAESELQRLSRSLSGKLVVYQSSESPAAVARVAGVLESAGAKVVTVSFADTVFHETLTLLASCRDEIWDQAEPLLTKIGTQVFRCGQKPGDARAMLLIDRMVTAACGLGTVEAIAAGLKMGLSHQSLLKVMNSGSGRNFMTRTILPDVLEGKRPLDLSLAELVTDLNQAMSLAVDIAMPTLIAGVAHGSIQAAENRLGSERQFSDIHQYVLGSAGSSSLQETSSSPSSREVPQSSATNAYRVGYVGLGAMGAPLAGRLLSNMLTVHDPRADQVQSLREKGAVAASSLRDVGKNSDIVFLCLPSTKIVRDVLFSPGGLVDALSAGAIVVDQTTGDPIEAIEIARELSRKGMFFIDAPVSGGPETAEAGTATIICGGDQAAFEKVSPLLAQISPNITYCGSSGSGHAAKLVNNASNICNRMICYEAAALAYKLGLDLNVVDEVVNRSSGWSFAAQRMFKSVQAHSQTATISLELTLKDIWSAVEIGIASGAPMTVANTVRSLFQIGVAEFGAEANVDEIVLLFERLGQFDFRTPHSAIHAHSH